MVNNNNLQAAKDSKYDEFYTTYESIVEELSHYTSHFCNKIVLCNCDDPFESNFCKYFLRNFNILKLKGLLCTSYKESKIVSFQPSLFDCNTHIDEINHGFVLKVFSADADISSFSDEDFKNWLKENNRIGKLDSSGDFRSEECIKLLQEADIVVTNPPF